MRRLLVSALVVGAAAAGLSWNSPAAVRSVSIAWAGDIAMVGSSDGGAGFFSPSIRKQLRSDLVIGNLEGTLTVGGRRNAGLRAPIASRSARRPRTRACSGRPASLVPPGVPVPDPDEAAHGVVRRLSRQDFGRNAMRVTPRGRLLPPAWRTG